MAVTNLNPVRWIMGSPYPRFPEISLPDCKSLASPLAHRHTEHRRRHTASTPGWARSARLAKHIVTVYLCPYLRPRHGRAFTALDMAQRKVFCNVRPSPDGEALMRDVRSPGNLVGLLGTQTLADNDALANSSRQVEPIWPTRHLVPPL